LKIVDQTGAAVVTLSGGLSDGKSSRSEETASVVVYTSIAEHRAIKEKVAAGKELSLDISPEAARDLAGNNLVANFDADGNRINPAIEIDSYDADSDRPYLSEKDGKINGVHYNHNSDPAGQLMFTFNEAIDKAYANIKADYITLSNSSGDSLTLRQEEIKRRQPGNVVEPHASVNQILFVLDSDHWNTIGGWTDPVYMKINPMLSKIRSPVTG
jgi:hypothetical protein